MFGINKLKKEVDALQQHHKRYSDHFELLRKKNEFLQREVWMIKHPSKFNVGDKVRLLQIIKTNSLVGVIKENDTVTIIEKNLSDNYKWNYRYLDGDKTGDLFDEEFYEKVDVEK